MKGGSLLLKSSLALSFPFLYAYGLIEKPVKRSAAPIVIGAEFQAHSLNLGWHLKSTSSTGTMSKATASILNNAAFMYQESNTDLPNYSYGGRVSMKANFHDDYTVMAVLGLESGMGDAKGYRPINVDGFGDLTTADWDAQDASFVTWKNKRVIAPAVFFGYQNIMFGIEYDMREYSITGHSPELALILNKKSIEDNQVLFGVRSGQNFTVNNVDVYLSFEFMTNLCTRANLEMENYFSDTLKYNIDRELVEGASFYEEGGPVDLVADDGFAAHDFVAEGPLDPILSEQKVASAYTNLIKASLGLSFKVTTL